MWTCPLSSESHLPVAILRFEACVIFHINRALRLYGHREWPLANWQPFRPAAATSSESLARGILHQQLRVPMLVGRIKYVKTKNNSTLVIKWCGYFQWPCKLRGIFIKTLFEYNVFKLVLPSRGIPVIFGEVLIFMTECN